MARKSDLHIVPLNDLREHETKTRECWCQPTLKSESGTVLVVHQSADGRELVERHGVN
jgi:hypothetical protein